MKKLTSEKVFLKFLDDDKEEYLVSVSDILDCGWPMSPYDGRYLDPVDDITYYANGKPLEDL